MSVRRRKIQARLDRQRLGRGPGSDSWNANTEQLKRVQARLARLEERQRAGETIPHEVMLAALSDRDFPVDKGEKDGACNRSACLDRPATCYNKSTQKFYCRVCAAKINHACGETVVIMDGGPIA